MIEMLNWTEPWISFASISQVRKYEWWRMNREWSMIEMLNWKEPWIYFESITKVRLLPFHTHTNPIPTSLCNRKHWIGLLYKRKDWVPFQPRCAISKVSQKLEYCLFPHTLTHTHITEPCHGTRLTFMILSKINLDWFMNDEWRMMNSTLLHRKKQNWTIPHPSRLNRFPSEQRTRSSALLHRKRHDWTVPHSNRLNRFPSEQRNRRCYIEKDKTEPFPIATETSALLPRKRFRIVTSKKTSLNCSPYQ